MNIDQIRGILERFSVGKMSPQLQENFNNDIVEPLNSILNFPAVENDSVSLSDVDIWGNSDVESEEENLFVDWGVPLQNDLRDLLVRIFC